MIRMVVRFPWILLPEPEVREKVRLPDSAEILRDLSTDTLCGHLDPVLSYLRSRGRKVESRHLRAQDGWLTVLMNGFFYKNEIHSRFECPEFVEWSYTEPHYGDGNSLTCTVCRNRLQGRFDPADPDRTLGTGR